jgi:hypothetical protein
MSDKNKTSVMITDSYYLIQDATFKGSVFAIAKESTRSGSQGGHSSQEKIIIKLCDEISDLIIERDALMAELNARKAVCEAMSESRRSANNERDGYKNATEILLEALECANNQWGDDYLWKKMKLSEDIDKAKTILDKLSAKKGR